MANLWNSEVVVRFCFLFMFWHIGPVGKSPAYISVIQTAYHPTWSNILTWDSCSPCISLPKRSDLQVYTQMCQHTPLISFGMFSFEQCYWCMLGSSQIRNCGTLNSCISVCMVWYLPNIQVTKSTKIIIHFGNGHTSGTTNHFDNKPKINLSTPTSDGMEIMASWFNISWMIS